MANLLIVEILQGKEGGWDWDIGTTCSAEDRYSAPVTVSYGSTVFCAILSRTEAVRPERLLIADSLEYSITQVLCANLMWILTANAEAQLRFETWFRAGSIRASPYCHWSSTFADTRKAKGIKNRVHSSSRHSHGQHIP